MIKAWTPWIILSVLVFIWGIPQVTALLMASGWQKLPVAGLHGLVEKVPPVVAAPATEAAIYNFNILLATGDPS